MATMNSKQQVNNEKNTQATPATNTPGTGITILEPQVQVECPFVAHVVADARKLSEAEAKAGAGVHAHLMLCLRSDSSGGSLIEWAFAPGFGPDGVPDIDRYLRDLSAIFKIGSTRFDVVENAVRGPIPATVEANSTTVEAPKTEGAAG